VSSETTRIDVLDKFDESELHRYGHVVRIASRFRVLTDSKRAKQLSDEALARGANFSIGPVTLDDVFVDIVGEAENEEGAHEE